MTIQRHDPEKRIKVVPMYIEGEELAQSASRTPDDAPMPPIASDASVERVTTALLGIVAVVIGVLTAAGLIAAIVIASAGDWALATDVAYVAIGMSVVAVGGGVTAVVLRRGRRSGALAVILGVCANPLVLLVVLQFFAGGETG